MYKFIVTVAFCLLYSVTVLELCNREFQTQGQLLGPRPESIVERSIIIASLSRRVHSSVHTSEMAMQTIFTVNIHTHAHTHI